MGQSPLIEDRMPHFANSLSHPDIVIRRCNLLEPVDVVERADGIRVVSPPRLAFDLEVVLYDALRCAGGGSGQFRSTT